MVDVVIVRPFTDTACCPGVEGIWGPSTRASYRTGRSAPRRLRNTSSQHQLCLSLLSRKCGLSRPHLLSLLPQPIPQGWAMSATCNQGPADTVPSKHDQSQTKPAFLPRAPPRTTEDNSKSETTQSQKADTDGCALHLGAPQQRTSHPGVQVGLHPGHAPGPH